MSKKVTKTTVSGGAITREAQTGRFVSVQTSKGVGKVSKLSETTIKEVSNRRRDALKRLADR